MTDRELLEKSAKAAGIELDWDVPPNSPPWRITGDGEERGPASPWDPESDDGDALRLAVKLGIHLQFAMDCIAAYAGNVYAKQFVEHEGSDPYAATRRAIVRAAAQMAKDGV